MSAQETWLDKCSERNKSDFALIILELARTLPYEHPELKGFPYNASRHRQL